MTTRSTEDFALSGLSPERWNADRFFPKSHRVESGESEESSTNSHNSVTMGWSGIVSRSYILRTSFVGDCGLTATA